MNSMTTEQLLMCEKADLVKYIEELHNDINAISHEFMSGDDTLEDIHGYIEQKTDEIVELHEQVEELKASEQLASHVAKVNAEDIVELQKEIKELQKKNEEQYAEWVKVKNACELYKGFMAHHVSEQIDHDMENRCFGQVDISAGKWMSKFLQEKFYEEIIPVIIKEITDDNVDRGEVSYDNVYSGEVSLDHIGNGCISYTYLEDIQEE